MIFYSPFDIGYKAAKFLPVKVLFSAMKEVYRCKKVSDGVAHAAKAYPSGYFAMLVIGVLKGKPIYKAKSDFTLSQKKFLNFQTCTVQGLLSFISLADGEAWFTPTGVRWGVRESKSI